MGMHLTSLEWLALLARIHYWSLESISQGKRSLCFLYYTILYHNIKLMILHQHN